MFQAIQQCAYSGFSVIKQVFPGTNKAPPDPDEFEPFSVLIAVAMHALHGEKKTKYQPEGRRMTAMVPSEYNVGGYDLQGLVRWYWWLSQDDLVIIGPILNDFLTSHLMNPKEDKDKFLLYNQEIRKFLQYVVFGLTSLSKTYHGKAIGQSCNLWRIHIWDTAITSAEKIKRIAKSAMKEKSQEIEKPNVIDHEKASPSSSKSATIDRKKERKEMIEKLTTYGRLTRINNLFEEIMNELNISIPPLPDDTSYLECTFANQTSSSSRNAEPNDPKEALYDRLTTQLNANLETLEEIHKNAPCTKRKYKHLTDQLLSIQKELEQKFDEFVAAKPLK
jgi:hypothetical protein